jgi:Skp family chaperone for outer membrane proteins
MRVLLLILVTVVSVAISSGCGNSGGVDTEKTVAQVKAEAATMDQADLQKMADAYQAQITKKSSELMAKTEELKNIPLNEMLGDKAKKLKAEIAEKTKYIDALKERMQVYLDEVKKKAAQ